MTMTASFIKCDVDVPYTHDESMNSALYELCSTVVPDMNNASKEEFTSKILSGGLTNVLMVASTPKITVVVRVYGLESERIIDRTAELMYQSMFIRTFGKGKNALVYEFLGGYRPLDPQELAGPHRSSIARAIAHFHWKASAGCLVMYPYATERTDTENFLSDWVSQTQCEDVARKIKAKRDAALFDGVVSSLSSVVPILRERVAHLHREMPIVVCHNDLLSANIMLRAEDSDIRLIDFEYTHRNYLYFDIANHFNEYAGFECEWARYPAKDQQLAFLNEYFSAMAELTEVSIERTCLPSPERLHALVEFCSLLSHVKWALWAVLQEAHSTIDFDYLSYARQRLDRCESEMVRIESLLKSSE